MPKQLKTSDTLIKIVVWMWTLKKSNEPLCFLAWLGMENYHYSKKAWPVIKCIGLCEHIQLMKVAITVLLINSVCTYINNSVGIWTMGIIKYRIADFLVLYIVLIVPVPMALNQCQQISSCFPHRYVQHLFL